MIHDYGAFGLGTGPVWLTQIKCDGSEQSLEQCHHAGWGNNSCDHGYDVGVVCELCSTGKYLPEETSRNGVYPGGRKEIFHIRDTDMGSIQFRNWN